jgi:hypothetical protein
MPSAGEHDQEQLDAADGREVTADERERRADERERRADEREALADERERLADERDRLADERERHLDGLAQQLGVRSVIQLRRGHEAITRSRAMLSRGKDHLDRSEAALGREAASADRDQADVDRATAQSERELARPPADAHELVDQAGALRRHLFAMAADLAAAEEEAARIHDELGAHHSEQANDDRSSARPGPPQHPARPAKSGGPPQAK